MLKEIYTTFGGVGTFFITIGMFVTVMSWWLAVTGAVVRDMDAWKKLALVLIASLIPPLSLGMLVFFTIKDRTATSEIVVNEAETEKIVLPRSNATMLVPKTFVASRAVA